MNIYELRTMINLLKEDQKTGGYYGCNKDLIAFYEKKEKQLARDISLKISEVLVKN